MSLIDYSETPEERNLRVQEERRERVDPNYVNPEATSDASNDADEQPAPEADDSVKDATE